LAAPNLYWPIDFIHLFFNESWILVSFLSLLFIFTFLVGKKKWNKASTFSISVFVVTFIGAFILSHVFTPILREIVMQFILPFLFLPLFYLLELEFLKKLAMQ
jgi:cation transport ATPase